jgi:hypothetical protein
VHLHSPLSHDACDGEGFADGMLLAPDCLADLRAAVCELNVDVAMLTDHAPHVNEVPFEDATWAADGDERITDTDGNTFAARWACDSGRRVLVTQGSENRIMPVGLHRHPGASADPMVIDEAYEADGPTAAQAYRDAGGLALVAHTEERSIDYLRDLAPDGIEIYNLHAGVDPVARENHLGLDTGTYLAQMLEFVDRRSRMASDLVFMALFEVSPVYAERWDTLLAEGMRITGHAGNDAHQNTFPNAMPDGERTDSYRRMLRWFSNHLLVDGTDPDDVLEALDVGRLYVAFELFGSPVGFDFRAEASGTTYEMGDEAPVGAELTVVRPTLPPGFPQDPPPSITMRLLRSEAGAAVEVATADEGDLTHTPDTPGSYRAEVHIVPEHTRPYLDSLADTLIQSRPWILSNPIHVVP